MKEPLGFKERVSVDVAKAIKKEFVLRGKVEIEKKNGTKIVLDNTIQDALLNAVANAMADGTMTAVNAMDFYYSGAWNHIQATTVDGGGTGSEAWTRWKAEMTATETITVSSVRLGVQSGGSWQTTYSEVAITSVTLNSGDTLIVKWTITAST